MLKFEWDPVKAKSNQKKHGVTFAEASSCFYDPMHILIDDPDSTADEDRLILIGASSKSQILVVVHVDITGDKNPHHLGPQGNQNGTQAIRGGLK